MHAHKDTVRAIIGAGHDYCIGVKNNQKLFLKKIQEHVSTHTCKDIDITIEKNRDRHEVRTVKVYTPFYGVKKDWMGLHSFIVVERSRRTPSKSWHGKKSIYDHSVEKSYYISSLKSDTPAQEFSAGIRSHWAIENSLHYVKDVTFGEDASRIRSGNAPQNMSLIRNIVLNVFRKHGKDNIAETRETIGGDVALMSGFLGA